GTARTTTLLSSTQVTAALLASDRASGGTHNITVVTPAPGGGTSNTVVLTVTGPTATVGSTTVAPGATVSVTVSNGPGNPTDWVAWFCPASLTSDSGPLTDYKYLNNTQTPPTTGLTAATVTFTAPTTFG